MEGSAKLGTPGRPRRSASWVALGLPIFLLAGLGPLLAPVWRGVTRAVDLWQWGDVPSWIEAIGTSTAFMVAAAALRHELRDRRERQAQSVSAWTSDVDLDGGCGLALRNASQLPVHSVGIVVVFEIRALRADLSTGPPQFIRVAFGRNVLPPAEAPISERVQSDFWAEATADLNSLTTITWVLMQFRDAGGRGWAKDHRGRLRPHTLMHLDQWADHAEAILRSDRQDVTLGG
jgi:hypothetical protein